MYCFCTSMHLTSFAGLSVNLTTSGSPTVGSTNYTISCVVTLVGLTGTPSNTWRSPSGIVISTDTDFTAGDVTGSGPTYSSVLIFNSFKTSQAGEYTCTAEVDSVTNLSTANISVTSMFYMSNG